MIHNKYLNKLKEFPEPVRQFGGLVTLTIIVNSRVFIKSLIEFIDILNYNNNKKNKKSIAIYGLGKEGIALYESTLSRENINVKFFIDNSKEFQNRFINNIRVVSIEDIKNVIVKQKITEIYLASSFKNNFVN